MIPAISQTPQTEIRSCQYRDLEAVEQLLVQTEAHTASEPAKSPLQGIRHWYGLLKLLSWFPNPLQYLFYAQVAEQDHQVVGVIQVSPFNRSRSTWQVQGVAIAATVSRLEIGSQLLRHCLQTIREARTWLLEVNVNHQDAIALYRQNGFQPLAQLTEWAIAPETLTKLAEREPDLPNLLPVSNADAQLLYQLDTVAMPPLVRQVFDRHIDDFKTTLLESAIAGIRQWIQRTEVVSGYVFETQRKAAIGYFQIQLAKNGQAPHQAELTVHPAYTWLYPELLSQMARIAQDFPMQGLKLSSLDYQPEREEYLERIGATRIQHALLMSRSVWHKLRETKPVSLVERQLSEVLQGLQPARKPVPGRMSVLNSMSNQMSAEVEAETPDRKPIESSGNGLKPPDFPNINPEES